MGYIPLPEMTNIGDTRVDERRILCCNFHYFEAKKNCFWVVPFDKDDDPVDSFLTRVKQKHKLLRGESRLRFKPPRYQEDEEPLEPFLIGAKPQRYRRVRNNKVNRGTHKVHFLEGSKITCGLPAMSVVSSTEIDPITCKNCISILNQRALEQEPVQV